MNRVARLTMRFYAVLFTIGLLVGCNEADAPPEIKSFQKSGLASHFSHGGEPEIVLQIGGKQFRRVLGRSPYYLPVKELNSIYFVTDGGNQRSVCHVFNLQTRKDIAISTDMSELGHGVGAIGDGSESITGASNKIVIVGRRYGDKQALYSLDLKKRKLTSMEIVVFRDGTNVLERHKFEL